MVTSPTEVNAAEAEAGCADLAAMAEMSAMEDETDLVAVLDHLPKEPSEEQVRTLLRSSSGYTLETFLAPGGSWNGSETPVRRAALVGTRNGLTITSLKRSSGNPGSDHHTSQRSSCAVDLSNGTSPTVEMQRTANRIAAAMGYRFPANGYLVTPKTKRGYRAQLIYNSSVMPNHHNHVHFGVRKVG